tara:strand:+ start:1879 stop:2700 length:822 start_codon:yes stop_codon:yes gene_type:complete
MKRIIVFTSSNLRHKALIKILGNSPKLKVVDAFHEAGNILSHLVLKKERNTLQKNHLIARNQSEEDVFGLFLSQKGEELSTTVKRGWFSSQECLNKVKKIKPDLILVYGTSIIKGEIIKYFKNKILNVHLGLSPYYRGSGTNYFPFVNNEPEYCGATYMFLDEGIDTGKIIHQIRPNIYSVDSFHQLSNRFLIKVFKTYSLIAENFESICIINNLERNKNTKRIFTKRSDFSEESVITLYKNFADGMIEKYLDNKEVRDSKVPLVQQNYKRNP